MLLRQKLKNAKNSKHVLNFKLCVNVSLNAQMTQNDTIISILVTQIKHVQTCHLSNYTVWNGSTNMSTCQNTMIWFDTILKICPDLSQNYDAILHVPNMSRLDTKWYNLTTWQNTPKFEQTADKVTHYKAIPRTAFDKRAVKKVTLDVTKWKFRLFPSKTVIFFILQGYNLVIIWILK